ncbi:ArsR/SmtB family transcription factor [Nitratireductor soli]|uniref:ArsR/SmtB family transcription factor n=1 Tax=Nitratireductor soli TaxID=1670619 RepID=UPI00065DF018|nr:metalloregulator ArsR/SmtB family transcription factor [Nitratireductor soli]
MARVSLVGDVFGAIADPTRRLLLERLDGKEQSVGALTAGSGLTTAAISLHLQLLLKAGLVRRRVAGRHRLYRLDPTPLREITDWTTALTGFWEERLDELQELAEKIDASADRPDD